MPPPSTDLQNQTSVPSPATKRISRTVPHYLTRLAHEPSLGLYHLATHAQRRAAPALAGVARNADARRGAQNAAVLDARDAAVVLETLGQPAHERLRRIAALLRGAGDSVRFAGETRPGTEQDLGS